MALGERVGYVVLYCGLPSPLIYMLHLRKSDRLFQPNELIFEKHLGRNVQWHKTRLQKK